MVVTSKSRAISTKIRFFVLEHLDIDRAVLRITDKSYYWLINLSILAYFYILNQWFC